MTTLKRKGGQPPKKFSEQLAEGQWGFGGGGGKYGSIRNKNIKTVKITKNEKTFLNQRLKKKAVDGGEMKQSIPSLSVSGNNMKIKHRDIKKFDKFFNVSKSTDIFSGKVPPRILSGTIIKKLK